MKRGPTAAAELEEDPGADHESEPADLHQQENDHLSQDIPVRRGVYSYQTGNGDSRDRGEQGVNSGRSIT